MDEKKKYWIKIEKDFLKSSQIKVIKAMPNGKEYILFYLAIMLESTESEGHLRLNELVPYNEQMLAAVTDTNIDIVRVAIKVFQDLGMLQILENGTIFIPGVSKRLGKECESAERVRLYREREHLALQCNGNVTECNSIKDKDVDLDLNKERKVKHKYGQYSNVLLTDDEHTKLISETDGRDAIEYLSEYREMKGYKAKSDYLAIKKWVFTALKEHRQKETKASGITPAAMQQKAGFYGALAEFAKEDIK